MTLNEDGRMERIYIPRILYTFSFFFFFLYLSLGSAISLSVNQAGDDLSVKLVSSSNIIHHFGFTYTRTNIDGRFRE